MSDGIQTLKMRFDGTMTNRAEFLKRIRIAVMGLTGESMTLDALIIEIAKNIFDHAHGLGSLVITSNNGTFEFEIKDDGGGVHNYESCSNRSTLMGNGVNFGIGLEIIPQLAQSLGINLCVNASNGLSYSGIYVARKCAD